MPYFRDGKQILHFILVYKEKGLTDDKKEKLKMYLNNIQAIGLKTEQDPYSIHPDITFVKIHITDKTVLKFAHIFDVDISCKHFEYRPDIAQPRAFFGTPLTNPNPTDAVYWRSPESVSGRIPTEITSAERIMIISQLLSRARYGMAHGQYGLRKLLKEKIIMDAFPLHDGPFEWTESGPLNDRQLLAKYWACPAAWYKAQPLNLIEKYYGTEFALYFAWLGFYIQMLFPIAIISVFVVIIGFILMVSTTPILPAEICNSHLVMCPKCHSEGCRPERLKSSCVFAYISYLCDNPVTVLFAILMAIWSTVFMEFFQRQQAVLQMQWNVHALENDTSMRPEFVEGTTYKKISPTTGEAVPYTRKTVMCFRYAITIVSLAFLLLLMLIVMVMVMVLRVTLSLKIAGWKPSILNGFKDFIPSITAAFISAIVIFIFQWAYQLIAIALTNMENHRTIYEHKNSYIYKLYALSFVNNYAAIFYIAFFKGRFYTHPGDIQLWETIGGIGSDVCNFTGCIVDMAILLLIIMTVKSLASNVLQVYIPKLKKLIKKLRKMDVITLIDYEDEYLLPCSEEFFIVGEYMDMVIQYGFVTFFSVCFPLAPFLALCNNISEIRVDASKITKSFRRPVPSRVVGLGAWFGILQAMTYMGVVVNALVMAFTGNFIGVQIYKYVIRDDLKGYVGNFTISEFRMSDFHTFGEDEELRLAANYCYYQGQRYPPDHPRAYQHITEYWMSLALKFTVVVVFEHIVFLIKGLIAYAIPDVPFNVREQVRQQQKNNKKFRNQLLIEKYMDTRKGAHEDKINI